MTDILMPALSPTMEEGTLAKWHVKAGDTVKSGDVIAEIETDKATMEVEAVDEGVVTEILVAEGHRAADADRGGDAVIGPGGDIVGRGAALAGLLQREGQAKLALGRVHPQGLARVRGHGQRLCADGEVHRLAVPVARPRATGDRAYQRGGSDHDAQAA